MRAVSHPEEASVKVDFWQVLPVAFALLLVLEGLMPFVSPSTWRRMLASVSQLDNKGIRIAGLVSMLSGLALLYWVN